MFSHAYVNINYFELPVVNNGTCTNFATAISGEDWEITWILRHLLRGNIF